MFVTSYTKIYMALSQLAMLATASPLGKRQEPPLLSIFLQGSCQGTVSYVEMGAENSCQELDADAESYLLNANSVSFQLYTGGGCSQPVEQTTDGICLSPGVQVTGIQWHSGQQPFKRDRLEGW
ncbi:hypothetical protein GGI43DRAFT_414935 [Trichoderma evansii]